MAIRDLQQSEREFGEAAANVLSEYLVTMFQMSGELADDPAAQIIAVQLLYYASCVSLYSSLTRADMHEHLDRMLDDAPKNCGCQETLN